MRNAHAIRRWRVLSAHPTPSAPAISAVIRSSRSAPVHELAAAQQPRPSPAPPLTVEWASVMVITPVNECARPNDLAYPIPTIIDSRIQRRAWTRHHRYNSQRYHALIPAFRSTDFIHHARVVKSTGFEFVVHGSQTSGESQIDSGTFPLSSDRLPERGLRTLGKI